VIEVSKNELGAVLEKAAVGQGYDQGTGQWLSAIVIQALQIDLPALDWALEALEAIPEPPALTQTGKGWQCQNRAVMVAGPLLTDLIMAGEALDGQGFVALDVPILWTHLLEGGFAPLPGPFAVSEAQWQRLSAFAAKTYVPATAESRERGAG